MNLINISTIDLKNKEANYFKSLEYKLFGLSFISLPFTYALTINVGFPLKIYELSILLIIFIKLLKVVSTKKIFIINDVDSKKIILILLMFFLWCIISTLIGYSIISSYDINIHLDSWRESPQISSILKLIYTAIVIIFFILIINNMYLKSTVLAQYWLIGSVISGIYGVYVFVLPIIGFDPLLLPGQLEIQIDGSLFGKAIRQGTFREGNFASSYYVLSGVISYYLYNEFKKKRYILITAFMFVCVFLTLSTSGIVSLVCYFALFLLLQFKYKRIKFIHLITAIIFIGFMYIFYNSEYFNTYVVSKLFSDDSGSSLSRMDRLNTFFTAFEMFKSYPFSGTGLSNFGFIFPEFNVGIREGLSLFGLKRIINNVYMEILTETGFVGFIMMFLFIAKLIIKFLHSNKTKSQLILFSGLCTIFVSWIAFPTFSVMFHWVYFALAFIVFSKSNNKETVLNKGVSN